MGKVFVISDLHLSHFNMATKRGFNCSLSHDANIVEKWNKVVGKKDTVWILGDISMEKTSPYELLNHLNGYKKVVLGNHDKPQHTKKMLEYVNSVAGMVKLKGNILLTHCPIHPLEFFRFKLNIHGHVHENTLLDKRYFNASAEALDYTPIEISTITDLVKKNTLLDKIIISYSYIINLLK